MSGPGRPTLYSDELTTEICKRLADGRSLRSVCRDEDMPHFTVIFDWLRQYPEFEKLYIRAKEEAADAMSEDMLEIADDARNDWMRRHGEDDPGWVANGENVQRSRLRVDTRKWLAAKMKPKKYGDKVEHEHSGKVTLEQLVTSSLERNDSSSR